MSDQITVTSMRHPCGHIFPDGHRCGSPSLRREEFCYYHHPTRRPAPRRPRKTSGFHIAPPEDRASLQHSLGTILTRIASEQLDPRRASLLLHGIQIASLHLPRHAAPKSAPEPDIAHAQAGSAESRGQGGPEGQVQTLSPDLNPFF